MNKISRIRTGVKAFIVHEGKILVIKERIVDDGKERIIHDVPGGGIELGESLREALIREAAEEVGLSINVQYPVGAWEFIVDKKSEAVHIVCIGFRCSLVDKATIDTSKNPAQNEDIFEAIWLSKEEILKSDSIFVNADMRKALENIVI